MLTIESGHGDSTIKLTNILLWTEWLKTADFKKNICTSSDVWHFNKRAQSAKRHWNNQQMIFFHGVSLPILWFHPTSDAMDKSMEAEPNVSAQLAWINSWAKTYKWTVSIMWHHTYKLVIYLHKYLYTYIYIYYKYILHKHHHTLYI
jgi:hypothetical protein